MKTTKMNESQLRKMISKIIKESLSMEDVNSQPQFRQVDNLYDYINQNNIQMRQASKFARINAVQAKGGERINTVAGDGTQETTNVAKPGDFIVNNVGNPNNKWIIDAATFQKKYVPVQGQPGVFMPKGGPMMAGQINEPISFTAPWGEKMNIDKGGYIMQTPGSQTDIYGISGKDFNDTYRFDNLEESNKVRMNEAQLRKMVSNIIRESLEEIGGAPIGGQYMSILQKNGFQPMQSEDDTSWIDPNTDLSRGAFYISVITPSGWFHSKLYRCNEGTIFNVAERLTNALENNGWVKDAMAAARNSEEGYDFEYTDIAYIEGVFRGDYDDEGNIVGDEIGTDTFGAFAVDEDGYGFWND